MSIKKLERFKWFIVGFLSAVIVETTLMFIFLYLCL